MTSRRKRVERSDSSRIRINAHVDSALLLEVCVIVERNHGRRMQMPEILDEIFKGWLANAKSCDLTDIK